MRICGRCGASNTDDADFCGQCGTFLEFEDAPASSQTRAVSGEAAVSGTPAVSGETAPEQSTTSIVKTAAGQATGSASQPPGGPSVPQPPGGPSLPGQARQPGERVPQPGDQDPNVPAAVQPGVAAQRRRRPSEQAVDDRPRPGDILCPKCSTGNPPSRRFCRRCGASLADALLERVSWWRRLLRRLRGKPMVAGYRPPRRRGARSLWPILMTLVVLMVACGLVPQLRAPASRAFDTVKNAVLDRFGTSTRIVPRAASASSSASGTHPDELIDGASDTYWAPRPKAPAAGEWFQLELEHPVRVLEVIITPGISTDEKKFRTQSRPRTLQVVATDSAGHQTRKTVTVGDGAGAKHVSLRISDVVRMRFVIIDSYDAKPGRVVAVAEVEVVARGASPGPSTTRRVPSIRATIRR